jgi:hypothetical protein
MNVSKTETPKPIRYKPSLAATAWQSGIAIGGYVGDKFGHAYAESHHLVGNGNILDAWSHINNAFDSTMIVGPVALAGMLIANKLRPARLTPKKAVAVGVLAFSAGLAANAIAETPAITYSTAMRDFSDAFHVVPEPFANAIPAINKSTADWRDEVYGDGASLVESGILIAAMWGRRRDLSGIGPSYVPTFRENITAFTV